MIDSVRIEAGGDEPNQVTEAIGLVLARLGLGQGLGDFMFGAHELVIEGAQHGGYKGRAKVNFGPMGAAAESLWRVGKDPYGEDRAEMEKLREQLNRDHANQPVLDVEALKALPGYRPSPERDLSIFNRILHEQRGNYTTAVWLRGQEHMGKDLPTNAYGTVTTEGEDNAESIFEYTQDILPGDEVMSVAEAVFEKCLIYTDALVRADKLAPREVKLGPENVAATCIVQGKAMIVVIEHPILTVSEFKHLAWGKANPVEFERGELPVLDGWELRDSQGILVTSEIDDGLVFERSQPLLLNPKAGSGG